MFPAFLKLDNKKCVVVGGGKVAERKLEYLSRIGANIVLISPIISERVQSMVDSGALTWINRNYHEGDIKGASLVFVTTDDSKTNRLISNEASNSGILVNVADKPDECDFIYPSIVKRGDLTIAISTGGKSPAMSKKVREQIEACVGPEYEEYLELAGDLRKKIQTKYGSTEGTKAFEKFFSSGILELLSENKRDEAKGRMENCI